jgi:hypothetical protein
VEAGSTAEIGGADWSAGKAACSDTELARLARTISSAGRAFGSSAILASAGVPDCGLTGFCRDPDCGIAALDGPGWRGTGSTLWPGAVLAAFPTLLKMPPLGVLQLSVASPGAVAGASPAGPCAVTRAGNGVRAVTGATWPSSVAKARPSCGPPATPGAAFLPDGDTRAKSALTAKRHDLSKKQCVQQPDTSRSAHRRDGHSKRRASGECRIHGATGSAIGTTDPANLADRPHRAVGQRLRCELRDSPKTAIFASEFKRRNRGTVSADIAPGRLADPIRRETSR